MRPAIVATVCAVALGSCGEDEKAASLSKAEYEQRFQQIIHETEEAAPDSRPETLQEQAEEMDAGLDRMREAADELAELEPPADVARAHAMFVEGTRALADDAEKLVSALRARDERRAAALLRNGAFIESAEAKKIGLARREFSEQGYDLGEVSEFP